jgi:hypothetical protein
MPAQNLGPHVAPLGMRFYTVMQFPAAYRNQVFIAEHGSWNRSFRITIVKLHDRRNAVGYEPFATGWLQGKRRGAARRMCSSRRTAHCWCRTIGRGGLLNPLSVVAVPVPVIGHYRTHDGRWYVHAADGWCVGDRGGVHDGCGIDDRPYHRAIPRPVVAISGRWRTIAISVRAIAGATPVARLAGRNREARAADGDAPRDVTRGCSRGERNAGRQHAGDGGADRGAKWTET